MSDECNEQSRTVLQRRTHTTRYSSMTSIFHGTSYFSAATRRETRQNRDEDRDRDISVSCWSI